MADMEVLSADAGVAGAVTHGCMKADDNNPGVNVGMHESCGVGDRCRRRISRMWGCMEMEKSGCV